MAGGKERQSNFEILRIVSMMLIVMSHCDEIFGLFNLYSTSLGTNKIITDWFHIGGQIGVGCFVLISGYFMVEQKLSTRKILKLMGEVWFYTIGMWIIWMTSNLFMGEINVNDCIVETVYAFFPIMFSRYWFVTAYVILLILSPFLNKFIFSLDRQSYRSFLACILVIFVVLLGGVPGILQDMTEGRLLAVLIMYFIAGYIRRFGAVREGKASKHFWVAIAFYFLLFVTDYVFTYLGTVLNNQTIMSGRYFYRSLNSPIVVVICVEMFVGFLKLNVKNNKVVNEIAACTFGVYLLHSNRLMLRYLVKFFPIYKETSSLLIFTYSVVSMLLIYIISTLIDYVRSHTIEKIWLGFLDKYLIKVQDRITRTVNRICGFVKKWIDKYYEG